MGWAGKATLAIAILALAGVAAVGWLVWDTRKLVTQIAYDMPSDDLHEPDWVRRIEHSADTAASEASDAAKAAKAAEAAAQQACEQVANSIYC